MTKPVEFMKTYDVADDEIWSVRPGIFAIKHAALERVAAEQKITFDLPVVLEANTKEKIFVLCVSGNMGERTEWSIGEASPKNCKNDYPAAMAEKRAKDRVTLKLLNAHGAIYSDSEADDFEEPKNGNVKYATLPKKDAKEIYTKMQAEIREWSSRDMGRAWMEANKDRIKVLPDDWQDILRLLCEEMLADLRNKEAA